VSLVLFADTDGPGRAGLAATLDRAGLHVVEASTGRDAIDAARERRPHLIVVAAGLDDGRGADWCRAIRDEPTTRGIPVLFLVDEGRADQVRCGLLAGANDCLERSAVPELAIARVARLARESQLLDAMRLNEQLAQVGRLLGGIVHEIRGPLSVIRGNAEILRLALGESSDVLVFLDPIERNAEVLQHRLEHLMAAVRGGPARLEATDLGPLLREATDIFRKTIDPAARGVAVRLDLPTAIPAVLVDAGRLIQVLLNLLANAREAIGDAGAGTSILVKAGERDDDRRSWVVVEVEDDGPGIPAAHLDRIFEPFYTTKPTGSGYGLFLAEAILREHGGKLTACNRDPRGACFAVWLVPADRGEGA